MDVNQVPRLLDKQQQGESPIIQIDALKSIDVPNKIRDLCQFVGLVNYYMDMWIKRTHKISPLNKLCYTKVKFEWTDVEQKLLMGFKILVGRCVLL